MAGDLYGARRERSGRVEKKKARKTGEASRQRVTWAAHKATILGRMGDGPNWWWAEWRKPRRGVARGRNLQ
uniref:Uncharacterized protein n=1 Tax=Oryza rufipogon TaxID=4529 RepID=A0A0E0QLC2_ORYRU